jgi:hypothetical protein
MESPANPVRFTPVLERRRERFGEPGSDGVSTDRLLVG